MKNTGRTNQKMGAPFAFMPLFKENPKDLIEAGRQISETNRATLNERVSKKIVEEGKVEEFQKQSAPIIKAVKEEGEKTRVSSVQEIQVYRLDNYPLKNVPPKPLVYQNPPALLTEEPNESMHQNAVFHGKLGGSTVELRKTASKYEFYVIQRDKTTGKIPGNESILQFLLSGKYLNLMVSTFPVVKSVNSAAKAVDNLQKINAIMIFSGVNPPDWNFYYDEAKKLIPHIVANKKKDKGKEPAGKEPADTPGPASGSVDEDSDPLPPSESEKTKKPPPSYEMDQFLQKLKDMEDLESLGFTHEAAETLHKDGKQKGHGKKSSSAMKILTQNGYGKFAEKGPKRNLTGFGKFRKEIRNMKKESQKGNGALILKAGNSFDMMKKLQDRLEMWKLGNESPRILAEIKGLLNELIQENQIAAKDAVSILRSIGKSF